MRSGKDERGRAIRRRAVLTCAAIVTLAAAIYFNALTNPFVYDDRRLVVDNTSLRHPGEIQGLIFYQSTRPLVNVSYALDYAIWGLEPFGFHLTNVLFHALNVGLLFVIAWRAVRDRQARHELEPDEGLWAGTVASGAALLFAVHPMMTQAVGYISGRSAVLCVTGLLLSLVAARHWMIAYRARWLVAALVCWAAALLSKEPAAMFPVGLLIYERWLVPGTAADRRRRLRWLHLPVFGLAALGIGVRLFVFLVLEHGGAARVWWSLALVELDVIRRYVALLVFPRGQSIFHDVAPLAGALDPRVLIGAALVTGLCLVAWQYRRAASIVSFGLFWFLLMLVPSVVLVLFDRGEPMAEQRVYVGSVGFFLAAGAGLGWLSAWLRRARRITRWIVELAAFVLVLILIGHTLLRNAIWADPVTLWTEAVAEAPDHWLPNLALGEALLEAGRCEEAVARFAISLQQNPDEPAGYGKLGLCLLELGSADQARASFQQLLRRDPDSVEASNGLGAVALVSGRLDRARARYEASLAMDPMNVAAHRVLAVLDEPADPESALRHCLAIAEVAPETAGNDECIRRTRARLAAAGSR